MTSTETSNTFAATRQRIERLLAGAGYDPQAERLAKRKDGKAA